MTDWTDKLREEMTNAQRESKTMEFVEVKRPCKIVYKEPVPYQLFLTNQLALGIWTDVTTSVHLVEEFKVHRVTHSPRR